MTLSRFVLSLAIVAFPSVGFAADPVSSSAAESAAKDAPAKDAPAKDAPAKDAPAKDAPAKDSQINPAVFGPDPAPSKSPKERLQDRFYSDGDGCGGFSTGKGVDPWGCVKDGTIVGGISIKFGDGKARCPSRVPANAAPERKFQWKVK